MQDIRDEQQGAKNITTYVQIFREKLDNLERRGQGLCQEAVALREALARVDCQTGSTIQGYDEPAASADE